MHSLAKSKKFQLIITDALAGMRLDKALSTHPEVISRTQASYLIDSGHVLKNLKPIKSSHKTSLGEIFEVTLIEKSKLDLEPLQLTLDVVYEDDDLIVINKPAGLVMHPAVGHANDTLVNALMYHQGITDLKNDNVRPGIVHRIDKDTTGLVVIAKNELTLQGLAEQFKKKSVHRIYWAIIYGHISKVHGTVRSYLRRHPEQRKKFASEKLTAQMIPKGKLAITHYQVKKHLPNGLSLVHCQLETGRTHQIRVHMSEMHHPIVGDPIYCSAQRFKSLKSVKTQILLKNNKHMLLHAAELGFIHPRKKIELKFSTPWSPSVRDLLISLGVTDV